MSEVGAVPAAAAPAEVTPAAAAPAPAPATTPAAEAPAAAEAPPAGEPPPWARDRIDRLTKDKKVLEERLAALAAAPAPAPASVPGAAPAVLPAAEIEQRAQALASQREFTNTCNGIATKGNEAHKDFQETIAKLSMVGGPQWINPDLVGSVVEAGDAHEILYALGKDLTEASRILNLPPAQQGVAIAKFAIDRKTKAAAAPIVSNAPAPPSASVGGAPAASDEPQPTDSSEEWFAKRERQREKRLANA